MSDSLELNPIPAFELSRALYLEEDAKRVLERMTQREKNQVVYLMNLLSTRLKHANCSCNSYMTRTLLRKPLVIKDFCVTENIRQYLDCLGYESELIHVSISPNEISPTLVIKK